PVREHVDRDHPPGAARRAPGGPRTSGRPAADRGVWVRPDVGRLPARMGVTLSGPIALLFPGQGAQRPGIGRRLCERYPAAQRAFERAEEVLRMPVRRLCFEGPEAELNRTENIQPCVMTVCWAAYEVWRESYGMEQVRVMAGHSLGEFTALA